VPLSLPKKTKLYVEQCARERDCAKSMHTVFQRDLCRVRLATARQFVGIISHGSSTTSHVRTGGLQLGARVTGLGPSFVLTAEITNSGVRALPHSWVSIRYDRDMYSAPRPLVDCGVLLPGVPKEVRFPIKCIGPEGGCAAVMVYVGTHKSTLPLLSASVAMPMHDATPDGHLA
jgi:Bardet-Biedl syndrome 1 protein